MSGGIVLGGRRPTNDEIHDCANTENERARLLVGLFLSFEMFWRSSVARNAFQGRPPLRLEISMSN